MLNVSLTTCLVLSVSYWNFSRGTGPWTDVCNPAKADSSPVTRSVTEGSARGDGKEKKEKNFSFPSPLALPFSRFGNIPHRLWSLVNKIICISPLTLFLIYPLSIWLETATEIPLLSTGLLPRLQRNMLEYFPKHIMGQYVWEWTCLAVRIVSIICLRGICKNLNYCDTCVAVYSQ